MIICLTKIIKIFPNRTTRIVLKSPQSIIVENISNLAVVRKKGGFICYKSIAPF